MEGKGRMKKKGKANLQAKPSLPAFQPACQPAYQLAN